MVRRHPETAILYKQTRFYPNLPKLPMHMMICGRSAAGKGTLITLLAVFKGSSHIGTFEVGCACAPKSRPSFCQFPENRFFRFFPFFQFLSFSPFSDFSFFSVFSILGIYRLFPIFIFFQFFFEIWNLAVLQLFGRLTVVSER